MLFCDRSSLPSQWIKLSQCFVKENADNSYIIPPVLLLPPIPTHSIYLLWQVIHVPSYFIPLSILLQKNKVQPSQLLTQSELCVGNFLQWITDPCSHLQHLDAFHACCPWKFYLTTQIKRWNTGTHYFRRSRCDHSTWFCMSLASFVSTNRWILYYPYLNKLKFGCISIILWLSNDHLSSHLEYATTWELSGMLWRQKVVSLSRYSLWC